MTRTEFSIYRNIYVGAMRRALREARSPSLDEAAFPAYSHGQPLINYLFWQRLKKVFDYLEKKRFASALDFGCGSGVALQFLSRISKCVIAADVDLLPLDRMMSQIPLPQNVEVCDLNKRGVQDFEPSSFDLVLALDVLEHVADLGQTLRDLVRVIAPGGMIIVSGPTENLFYRMGRKLAGREFTGGYHVRSVQEIRQELVKFVPVQPVATLYYPVPLFEIFCGLVSP